MKRLCIIYFSLYLNVTLLSAQTFEYRSYYDDEKTILKEVITVRSSDSVIHGPYTSYYQNGSLLAKGTYTNNVPDDIWSYYFQNGEPKARGPLVKGQQTGEWQYFYENGGVKSEGDLKNGTKNGHWVNFYEDGEEKSRGGYQDDQKDGIWNYFYEDGVLRAQSFYAHGEGDYKEYFPSGQLKAQGSKVNEKSTGIWNYYHENSKLQATGMFREGFRTGRWIIYHDNGQKAAEGSYEKSKRTGHWTFYHANGNLSAQGQLIDDQRDGGWTVYYEDGAVRSEGALENGTGIITEYYPNGNVLAKGPVEKGIKSGNWEFYDDQGDLDGEAYYDDGIGEYKGYYSSGSIKMTGKLDNTKRIGEWSLFDQEGNMVGKYKPIYEEDRPIYRIHDVVDEDFVRSSAGKPDYLFKNRSNRYFDAVINEFKGLIIAVNPLGLPVNEFPVSVEHYVQERLGYELQFAYVRDPLFKRFDNLQLEDLYSSGIRLKVRQKFYQRDKKLGMINFGHNLSFSRTLYNVDAENQNTGFQKRTYSSNETIVAYGLFIGWRWLRNPGRPGFTLDGFIGADIGLRNWEKEYDPTEEIDILFEDANQSKLYLPFVFGVNIGWLSSARDLFN